MEEKKKEKLVKPMGWVKNLLNNIALLKWVRKYSADNLCDDNKLAEKFGVKCNEESLSIGDSTMTKLIVTQARFSGKEYTRFNIKQIKPVLDLLSGKEGEGELIVSAENNNEMFLQIKDTIVIISPLPKTDKEEEEKKE